MSNNHIAKTWISGQRSCTLIIEKGLAEEYGLTQPSHVLLVKRPEGILIRKLEFKDSVPRAHV
jgi:hypothetical protein